MWDTKTFRLSVLIIVNSSKFQHSGSICRFRLHFFFLPLSLSLSLSRPAFHFCVSLYVRVHILFQQTKCFLVKMITIWALTLNFDLDFLPLLQLPLANVAFVYIAKPILWLNKKLVRRKELKWKQDIVVNVDTITNTKICLHLPILAVLFCQMQTTE